ncbi:DUF3037 domain-containing protein [Calidifontibacter terrae]
MIGYQWAALRFVPAVEREEFLNVGVVMYAQMADFLEVRWRLRPALLTQLAPDVDLIDVESALKVLAECAAGQSPAGRPQITALGPRFGWLTAPRSTVVQPGPVHGGRTADPAADLARLLDRVVG